MGIALMLYMPLLLICSHFLLELTIVGPRGLFAFTLCINGY